MSDRFISDLAGTGKSQFQVGGTSGPGVANESSELAARDAANAAYVALRALLFKTYGDDFELNSGATGAGDDWTMTLRRPSTGMTHDLVLVMPSGDPAPGQALTVASFAGDVITFEYTTIAAGNDKIVVDTTSLAFGDGATVNMFTKPDNGVVLRVECVVDATFNGTPTASVGIAGQTSKYMASNQLDLTADPATVFEVNPALPASGSEALIITFAAGGASQGLARFLVHYAIPS